MANVLNRTTKQFIASANTPDYPTLAWIIDPDMSAVVGFPSIYWVITGDNVTLMTQGQRDAVDAARLEANRDGTASTLDNLEAYTRAFALVTLDELNAHADKINAILTAIDGGSTLAQVKTAIAAISDYPQRTIQQMKNAVRGKLGT